MSTVQRGVISNILDRDWHGTKLWSFKIEGSERFWRTGKDKPECEAGDYVQFEEKNSNVTSLKVLPAGEKIVIPDQPDKPDVPTVDVGARIRYQAARADATRLVVAALHTEALPWTAVQQKNKSKKLDLLTGYIKQVTHTLLEQEEEG